MSSNSARENIFARLARAGHKSGYAPVPQPWEPETMERKVRLDRFVELMTAVRSEVYRVSEKQWMDKFQELLLEKGVKTLAYGPGSPLGDKVEKAWNKKKKPETTLVPWKGEAEDFKETLFQTDAGITSVKGGIAEAAALIIWPTPQEPRLLSLVPPIHFAVVRADDIYTSFPQAIRELNWARDAPTNALLISGPSKTADIELILQFGVHGPTDLVVIMVE